METVESRKAITIKGRRIELAPIERFSTLLHPLKWNPALHKRKEDETTLMMKAMLIDKVGLPDVLIIDNPREVARGVVFLKRMLTPKDFIDALPHRWRFNVTPGSNILINNARIGDDEIIGIFGLANFGTTRLQTERLEIEGDLAKGWVISGVQLLNVIEERIAILDTPIIIPPKHRITIRANCLAANAEEDLCLYGFVATRRGVA